MTRMKNNDGRLAGTVFGLGGLAAGQACAWAGFLSQPHHDAGSLGVFCGLMGAIIGVTAAVMGMIAKRDPAA